MQTPLQQSSTSFATVQAAPVGPQQNPSKEVWQVVGQLVEWSAYVQQVAPYTQSALVIHHGPPVNWHVELTQSSLMHSVLPSALQLPPVELASAHSWVVVLHHVPGSQSPSTLHGFPTPDMQIVGAVAQFQGNAWLLLGTEQMPNSH